ncbi:hypothetical protein [Microbulbifer sp. JSM ZJ756]|uniref:hypothetical protein n=1 Tax=Microbulbifer sp. JSM ZJ756 TaxID=3376191 RepID=UPI0037B656C9
MLNVQIQQMRTVLDLQRGLDVVSQWEDERARNAVTAAIREEINAIADGLVYIRQQQCVVPDCAQTHHLGGVANF